MQVIGPPVVPEGGPVPHIGLPVALTQARNYNRSMKLRRSALLALALAAVVAPVRAQQKYVDASGKLRVALARQPLSPTGPSKGPATMADGGIRPILEGMGAVVRVEEARLTPEEDTEYGGWKRLGMSLGHGARQQGARRPVERGAREAVRGDIHEVPEGVRDRLRDDSAD
jgi:hypothetical protein